MGMQYWTSMHFC
uniref:Uncharacterized protein n=1 Tax=Lotus japonicus TaxID=34305 RepID=I3SSG0_LOTJA|nr:unknown [Lotus japonicus]